MSIKPYVHFFSRLRFGQKVSFAKEIAKIFVIWLEGHFSNRNIHIFLSGQRGSLQQQKQRNFVIWLEGPFSNRNSKKICDLARGSLQQQKQPNFVQQDSQIFVADPNCSSDQVQVGLYCYLTVREVGQEGAEPACKEAGLSLWHPNIRSSAPPPFFVSFDLKFRTIEEKISIKT